VRHRELLAHLQRVLRNAYDLSGLTAAACGQYAAEIEQQLGRDYRSEFLVKLVAHLEKFRTHPSVDVLTPGQILDAIVTSIATAHSESGKEAKHEL